MFEIYILILTAHYSLCQNVNNSGRYYFRMGKSKNEFRITNRVYYLNHNITDYDYTHKGVDKVQLQKSNEDNSNNNYDSTYFLDDEWNFDHKNIVKTDLPLFVPKFYEKITPDMKTTTRILFNVNKGNSNNIIKFNLESLNSNETVSDAEFYFFWPLESSSEIFRESVVLRLYQFEKQVQGMFNDSTLIENPDIHKLFNVIYISKAQKGWQVFKIKKPIDNWLNGEDNLGLLLTISSYDDNKLVSVFNDTNEGVYRSFAVITVQNNETASTEQSAKYKETQINTNAPSCQKKEWTVSFKNLHWNDFIIAPDGFMAYDCTGKCLNAQTDNLNHVKLLRTFNKRPSCCVPVDYLSSPIMFYDKWGNIAIKNYENMIVTKCGCR
ncbi:bone morphogenetic protein 7-like [Anoplophora glabripennis]|uniref:bone morphogenetic protein 7-like n=1 Tax=Anoplophora glabripennis TaxID=217634 RepID=UPI000875871E|nr:bone morphogenetic protein 7-like [Anoplophora glabripennis]